MRIAYLSIGNHIHTERWLNSFVQRGHECHLITVTPGPIEGVTVHDLRTGIPYKPLHYGVGLLRLRRMLRRIRPDLLHAHFLQGYGYWSWLAGARPLVITVWGDDVYQAPHRSRLRMWLSRRALAAADLVTGDSEDILAAVAALGAAPEKLEQILWGVDPGRFRPVDGAPFREKWGIGPDAPLILSTRSFSREYYNIDTILEAGALLIERLPETVLVFAAYDGESSALAERARSLGIADSVRFVGRIEHSELPAALGAADVFVTVPSLDATAVSLLEAMACGCAVIASDLPSNREWIRDGENGFIVPPREARILADQAEALLRTPDLRARFGARCMDIARARADHEANMTRMEELCRELVAGARRV